MRNQTLKVLSTLTSHTVQHLLMGGQACVFYGAVQFSRDADIAILATDENLHCLQQALDDLQAEVVAIPPFERKYLERGLAVHFRCRRSGFENLRLDVMSVMRGVEPFVQLWNRRTTLQFADGQSIDLMNVADLVLAKKTQRDKDWPMIRALLEEHYTRYKHEPTTDVVEFWLREGRTPRMLIDVASQHVEAAELILAQRTLIKYAITGSESELRSALFDEQQREQELDRTYWQPLVAELEQLRQDRPRKE